MVNSAAKSAKKTEGKLSQVDTVTALLLAMGKAQADQIIRQFDNQDIREVARSAVELPEVRLERLEEWATRLSEEVDRAPPLVGSTDGAMELLGGVMTEESLSSLIGEIAGKPPKGIWQRLAAAPEEKLARFIESEEPQVAAYVLSNLDTTLASSLLEKIDADRQANLSARILNLKPIADYAAALLAERLAHDLFDVLPDEMAPGGHAKLGAMLNLLDRGQANQILIRLEKQSPEDARKVRGFIFGFEDIASLSLEDRSRLFDQIPSDRVSLALQGAPSDFVELVLSCLSPRSRRFVEAGLADNGAATVDSINGARRSVAATALSLADRLLIKLPQK